MERRNTVGRNTVGRNTVGINAVRGPNADLFELAKVDGLKSIQLQRMVDILNVPYITKSVSLDQYRRVK